MDPNEVTLKNLGSMLWITFVFARTARIHPPSMKPMKRRPKSGRKGSHVGARSLCDVSSPMVIWLVVFSQPLWTKYANVKLEIISGGIRGENKKWLKPPPSYGVVCVKAVCVFWLFFRTQCDSLHLSICLRTFGCLFRAGWVGWKHKKKKTSAFEGWPSKKWTHYNEFQCTNSTFSNPNHQPQTGNTIHHCQSHLWRYHNDIQSSMFAHHPQGYLSQTSPELFLREIEVVVIDLRIGSRLIHICVCDHVLLAALIIKTLHRESCRSTNCNKLRITARVISWNLRR